MSQNSRNQCFSYYFCLMIEGSGSVYLTNGSRSGRPKNLWLLRIRIRIRISSTAAHIGGTPKRRNLVYNAIFLVRTPETHGRNGQQKKKKRTQFLRAERSLSEEQQTFPGAWKSCTEV
jgi:hypothetical protein